MRSPGIANRSNAARLGTLALVGAAAYFAAPFVRRLIGRWNTAHPNAKKEPAIDESLKETYPASDPPSSRYFDIPVNRR